MTLDDVLIIKNGRNQRAVENPDGKYPIYGSGGIIGYADDYICEADTVIVGRKGSINNPIFVEEPFWNVDTAFGLVAKREVLLPRYLYYFCRNYDFERLNKAVTIPSLTKSDLLKIEITLPSLEIQEKIVNRLLKIEEVIQTRQQQLQKLDELVKARFVEMFGDPLSNDKGWQKVLITEVCHAIFGGGTPSKSHPEYFTGSIPWVSPKDMKSLVINDSIDHITEEAIAHSTTNLVPTNSVLMVIRSGILKHTLPVAVNSLPVTINQDMKAFVPNETVKTAFLMYFFKAIENDVLAGVRGVTADNIDFKAFQKRTIIVPPLALQEQFVAFVEQVDKSKVAVQKALDEAQLLFDSLIQKYFQ